MVRYGAHPGASPLPAAPASRSPHPSTDPPSRGPSHATAHRPRDARRRTPRRHRQEGRRLRHAGRLPAVVYGHGEESTNVSVDTHEFEQLRRHIGPNALVDLSIDGKKARPVLVSSVQVHPVNRRPLHVDLFLVRMTEELTVDVPLVATGESPAVDDRTAARSSTRPRSVRVRALPDHLPQSIEYSIESLVDFDATHPRQRPGDPRAT